MSSQRSSLLLSLSADTRSSDDVIIFEGHIWSAGGGWILDTDEAAAAAAATSGALRKRFRRATFDADSGHDGHDGHDHGHDGHNKHEEHLEAMECSEIVTEVEGATRHRRGARELDG